MDRDLNALDAAPGFSLRRLWVTLAVAASIIGVSAAVVRTFPNSGHQAGYEAVMTKGLPWVQSEVDADRPTALAACDALHRESEDSAASPRFEYNSFVTGCGEAVDQLLGRHVPLLVSDG